MSYYCNLCSDAGPTYQCYECALLTCQKCTKHKIPNFSFPVSGSCAKTKEPHCKRCFEATSTHHLPKIGVYCGACSNPTSESDLYQCKSCAGMVCSDCVPENQEDLDGSEEFACVDCIRA